MNAPPERWQGLPSDLTSLLAHLRTVVLAVVDLDGRLVEANRGFRRLVGLAADDADREVATAFVNPTFEDLASAAAALGPPTVDDDTRRLYRGLITLGGSTTIGATVRGEIHLHRGHLLVIAEHDIEDLETIAARMATLTEHMAESHRQLVHTKKRLERRETELETLAMTDPLTGLANRRQFERRLDEEIDRSERTDVPLSVIILDLDRFKPFNDAWGHLAGDACLVRIAEILSAHSRPYDTTARYGGEEFVLLLPGMSVDRARERAETLRDAIRDAAIPGTDAHVTASFGVASYADGTAEDLIQAADDALYAAKAAGRDRVHIAGS